MPREQWRAMTRRRTNGKVHTVDGGGFQSPVAICFTAKGYGAYGRMQGDCGGEYSGERAKEESSTGTGTGDQGLRNEPRSMFKVRMIRWNAARVIPHCAAAWVTLPPERSRASSR